MAEISANGKPRMVATNSQKNPEEYISEHQIPERRVSGRIIIYRTERRKQWAIILLMNTTYPNSSLDILLMKMEKYE